MEIYKLIKFSFQRKGMIKKILYLIYSSFYFFEFKKTKKNFKYNKDDIYPLF